jgi:hypothetical protein
MSKFLSLNISLIVFLILIVSGCQSKQKISSNDNLLEIPEGLHRKIFNDIYEKKNKFQLCQGEMDQSISNDSSSIYKLKEDQYLVEILCFFGAYQGNYQYFLYQINDSQPTISLLSFQELTKNKNNDFRVKSSINIGGIPDYNEENKILTVYTKGRGLADCGSFAKYQWQDSQFELREYRVKEKCDGNYIAPENYPKIYP